MDAYWKKYDRTLKRIESEKPQTFDGLKAILDEFEPPSSGDAFFPGGADETLGESLRAAGWHIEYREGDYLWLGTSKTGEVISHVEGDLYRGNAFLAR
ncbi:hypothetical protein [Microbacterium sp. KR10-403]|uniref:hypothetical protein n=1 Tax=Microbacterium sp. KR10-403 TaxID=3158581 RepID=UPI0032E3CBA0